MLTTKLQESLDKNWEDCWPVSDLRPLALIDLISYLFFIKKSDDLELIHQKVKDTGLDNFIFSKEIEEFSWSSLRGLSAKEIHQLFIKENGLIALMNYYGQLDFIYSDYFKSPLLIEPTPRLISNAIEIINIIETNDLTTRKKIIEYLFAKAGLSNKNNQLFLPEHILNLMVAIAVPVSGDSVFDPAAGNGSLLISAYEYINSGKNPRLSSPFQLTKPTISGVESNIVFLRIAAMNMILHGIDEPQLKATSEKWMKQKASLIISSLPSSEDITPSENTPIVLAGNELSLLNDIIENLTNSGRAVILVSQDLLQNEDQETINVRKKLVNQNNLEGVITLDNKSETLFPGTAILVFDNSKSTENIWFCKWRTATKKIRSSFDENRNYDRTEVAHILEQWKTRKDPSAFSTAYNFFIPVENIRSNNYNLSFNDYKLARPQEAQSPEDGKVIPETTETVLAAKKENLHEFFETSAPLPAKKNKRKLAPVLLILLIIIGAVTFYWVYSKDNYHYFKTKIFETGINTTQNNSKPTDSENAPAPSASKDYVSYTEPLKDQNNSASKTDSKKYTVVSKAWFHSGPDSAKIKPYFLMPRKELVLTSRNEENGFVYVIYTNSKGGTTHGWLDKKDLQPID